MNVRQLLDDRLSTAFSRVTNEWAPALVSPARRPEFGDYQVNGAMAVAKRLKTNPRKLAEDVVNAADLTGLVAKTEIAGPGFINLTLSQEFLSGTLARAHLVTPVAKPERIVIDYSSPNLAKSLHVGHLRSTVIGDATARTLELLGHTVYRQNHIGDWGTPFGMLVTYLEGQNQSSNDLGDFDHFYALASERFENDPAFAETARKFVVDLQSGKEAALTQWKQFIELSSSHMQRIYDQLNISLNPDHIRGESAYNNDLAQVVTDLDQAGLLRLSDGAKCVFLDEFTGKEGKPLPMLVQKSDGGYLYHTTDLAALRYRHSVLHADRILYFTDTRQNLHFRMLFAVAHAAEFVPKATKLEHHPFGKLLDSDGRPFRSRDGSTIPLAKLVEQAHERARAVVRSKSSNLDETEFDEVVHAVAIGAIKYADLSKNRLNDYTFDWDSMLAFEGNTAPYLQYAFARIQSLFARGNFDPESYRKDVALENRNERELAVQLCRFEETLELVARDAMPHHLCAYLYELTSRFMRFYETCPVLDAPEKDRESRLALCVHTAKTLETGLDCLGIATLTRM
ncbi:MAG: arginine--tRNA ligase [Pseudomonadales bacterium]